MSGRLSPKLLENTVLIDWLLRAVEGHRADLYKCWPLRRRHRGLTPGANSGNRCLYLIGNNRALTPISEVLGGLSLGNDAKFGGQRRVLKTPRNKRRLDWAFRMGWYDPKK
jgi:hypothetical protein